MGKGCREKQNVTRKRREKRRDTTVLWPALAALLVFGPAPFFGGCAFIQAPEPEPTPTKVPESFGYKDPNVFESTVQTVKGEPLNDPSGKDRTKPAFYRLTEVEAGDLMTLQPIVIGAGGSEFPMTDKKNPTPADLKKFQVKVKLVAVTCPDVGQPGWRESADATANWLSNRKLNLEVDPKYPLTKDERKIDRKVAQIVFDGTGKLTGQPVSFNQVLIRSGYAWVDLPTLSSLDYKPWLVDEQYARGVLAPLDERDNKFRVDKNGKPLPKPKAQPHGLWAKGIRPPAQPLATPTEVPAAVAAGGASGGSSASMSGSGSGSGSSSGMSSGSSSSSPSPSGTSSGP